MVTFTEEILNEKLHVLCSFVLLQRKKDVILIFYY